MDNICTLAPNSQTDANKQVFLRIIEGPKRESILQATGLPDRKVRQINAFTVKFKNIPIKVEISFDGCRYDRYNSDYIIVSGEVVNFQILIDTNKKVRKMLQRTKDFCSQVQLRYNYCTCDTGKILLHHAA